MPTFLWIILLFCTILTLGPEVSETPVATSLVRLVRLARLVRLVRLARIMGEPLRGAAKGLETLFEHAGTDTINLLGGLVVSPRVDGSSMAAVGMINTSFFAEPEDTRCSFCERRGFDCFKGDDGRCVMELVHRGGLCKENPILLRTEVDLYESTTTDDGRGLHFPSGPLAPEQVNLGKKCVECSRSGTECLPTKITYTTTEGKTVTNYTCQRCSDMGGITKDRCSFTETDFDENHTYWVAYGKKHKD